MTKVLLFAALVACIAVPFRVFVKGEQTKHRYKTTLALNGVMFFGLMLFTGVMMFSGNAFAAETAETAAVAASSTARGEWRGGAQERNPPLSGGLQAQASS